jgi:hypothetical protein
VANITELVADKPSIEGLLESMRARFEREPDYRKSLVIKSLNDSADLCFWHK